MAKVELEPINPNLPSTEKKRSNQYTFLTEQLHVGVAGPAGNRQVTCLVTDSIDSDPTSVRASLDAIFGIAVVTGTIAETLPAAVIAGIKDVFSADGVARMLASLNFSYWVLRQQITTSLFEPVNIPYIDFPNLLIAKVQQVDPEGTNVQLSMDPALKGYRIIPERGTDQDDTLLFYDYVTNGVIDHSIERAVVSQFESEEEVGALFEATLSQEIGARAIIPPTTTAFEINLTPRGKRHIENLVRGGTIVVLSGRRPTGWESRSLGWWEINPVTGWTQNTTEAGHHTGLTDQSIQTDNTLRQIPAVKQFGNKVCRAFEVLDVSLKVLAVIALSSDMQAGEARQALDALLAGARDMFAISTTLSVEGAVEKIIDMGCKKTEVEVKGRKTMNPPLSNPPPSHVDLGKLRNDPHINKSFKTSGGRGRFFRNPP